MTTDIKSLKDKKILIRWNQNLDGTKRDTCICEKSVIKVSPNGSCLMFRDLRYGVDRDEGQWFTPDEFEILDVLTD